MAGSLFTFVYTDNSAQKYLFTADKSNTLAVNGNAADAVAADIATQRGIPRNIIPRALRYSSTTTTRTLLIIAATQAVFNAPPATIPDPITSGGTLVLSGERAEKRRRFKSVDTGLTSP
jgi:hypothetical protein